MDSANDISPSMRGLHLHLGPRDEAVAAKLRQATPPGCALLYLHPGEPMRSPVPGSCVCVPLDPFDKALETLSGAIAGLGLDDGASVYSSSSCGLESLYGDRLREARRQASSALSSLRCAKAGGMLFLRASIQNIPSLLDCGSWRLSASFAGSNAVICGAGPSLAKAIPSLAKIQDRVAVIAVGRACRCLLEAGVTPDLVCEMDSLAHVNWPIGMKVDAPLLAPLTVSPDAAARFGTVLWTSVGGAPGLFANEFKFALPKVSMDRSVGVYALDAALGLFKFDEAALVGFDLCLGPAGVTHAGAAASDDGDASSLCEIPGRDGGTVVSNSLFAGMRESFESHWSMGSGRVFNCSEGGASIAGTVASDIESFAARRHPFSLKRSLLSAISYFPCDVARIREAIGTAAAKKLSGKGAWESGLRAAVAKHAVSLAQEAPSPFDAAKFAGRLLDELSDDFALAAGGVDRKPESHCVFDKSLRAYVLERLSLSHREFAELLAKGDPPSCGRHWRLAPNFMRPPFVELELADGTFFRLSSRLSMDAVAGEEVGAFLADGAFDPAKDVALFIAPGNWAHPLELARRMPQARMLVVEPWPELFSLLASRCQFLHKLPVVAQIVGAGELLPGWRAVLKRRLSRLEAEGFAVKRFPHPRTWLLPEIAALVESLR